jgi:hypothetical protein
MTIRRSIKEIVTSGVRLKKRSKVDESEHDIGGADNLSR